MKSENDVRGKEILILGMGASGMAAARLLAARGARVRCSERGAGEEIERRAGGLEAMGCRIEVGGHTEEFARGAELAVISPGMDPGIPLVKTLEAAGVPVLSEIEIASWFCAVPVIAITGTNGKTTAVTLLQRILSAAGRRAVACGNIGKPFSEAVEEMDAELFVLEVSSFQLERVEGFAPWIAVALNITEDHLDRYGGMDEYARAKGRIFRNLSGDGRAIVRSADKKIWEGLGVLGRGRVLEFSRGRGEGDGAFLDGDRLFLSMRGVRETICKRSEVPLAGAHNVENVLAAAVAASLCGVDAGTIGRAVRGFKGLAHRLEVAGTLRGVTFINDSKATNPDAVIKALQAAAGPVILIAGGRDKGFDYSIMREEISARAKSVILIGEAREKMARALEGSAEIRFAADLEEAVRSAVAGAATGDVVMLSPACSSYDMFRNFEERGDEFKRIVRALGAQL